MKRISILTIVFSWLVLLNSCRDEDLRPSPDINDNIGAVTKISVNPNKNFYNALNPLGSEEVEFTIDVDGFDVTEVSSVDIMLTYTEKDGTYNELEEKFEDKVYDEVKVGEVTSFPSTFTLSAAAAAEALDLDISYFEVGDGFNLMFPIHAADGRMFTVALNSDLCQQPAQPSFGGCNVRWAIACPSDLAGTYDSELTNLTLGGNPVDPGPYTDSGTLTSTKPGVYKFTDHTFGWWLNIYGEGPGAAAPLLNEVCNKLSWSGADEFGDTYSISNVSVSADQTKLTFDWVNTYGEGGTVTLTRTDDKLWPAGLTE